MTLLRIIYTPSLLIVYCPFVELCMIPHSSAVYVPPYCPAICSHSLLCPPSLISCVCSLITQLIVLLCMHPLLSSCVYSSLFCYVFTPSFPSYAKAPYCSAMCPPPNCSATCTHSLLSYVFSLPAQFSAVCTYSPLIVQLYLPPHYSAVCSSPHCPAMCPP